MSTQSMRTKEQVKQIIMQFSCTSESFQFFDQIEKWKNLRIKDETIKKICHILCIHNNIDCPRPYYKNRKAAYVKMDEHWTIFANDLQDFDIDVEYEDPFRERKKPIKYRCKLLGKEYNLSSNGSFGKIFTTRQHKHSHHELMEEINKTNELFGSSSDENQSRPIERKIEVIDEVDASSHNPDASSPDPFTEFVFEDDVEGDICWDTEGYTTSSPDVWPDV